MRIEEGKFYKRADGSVHGPARVVTGDSHYGWVVGNSAYTDDGWFYTDQQCSLDLVEEYTGGEAQKYVFEMYKGDDPIPDTGAAAFIAQLQRQDDAEEIVHVRMTKAKLLDDAKATVADRGTAYGGVEDNFARIARLWRAHFLNKDGVEIEITPGDVAQMMVLMKIARLENQPNHPDSWTDIAGYAACGAEITQDLPAVKKSA